MPGDILGTLGVKLTALTADFEKKMKSAEQSISSVGSAAKTVGAAAGAAFVGLSGALATVTALSSNQEKAELKLAAAIRGTGQSIDAEKIKAYAGELQKLTQFGDEQTITAAAMLTSFNLTEKQIIGLIPRVQNIAALYEKDLSQAAITVGKSLSGSASELRRFGITMTEAEQAQFKMANQADRVNILMQALDKNTGPAAQTLAQTAGVAFQQMTNALGDFGEALGKIVQGPIVDGMKSLTNIITNLTAEFKSLPAETKKTIAQFVLGATAVAGVIAALSGFAVVLPMIIAGFKAMAVIVGVALLPLIKFVAIAAAVAFAAFAIREAWETNLGGVRDAVRDATKFIRDKFAKISDFLSKIFKTTFGAIGRGIITVFGFATGKSADEIEALKQALDETVAEFTIAESLKESLELVKPSVKALGDDLARAAKSLGISMQTGLTKALGAALEFGKEKLAGMGFDVQDLIDQVKGLAAATTAKAPPTGAGGTGKAARTTIFASEADRELAALEASAVKAQDSMAKAVETHERFWASEDALTDSLIKLGKSFGNVGNAVEGIVKGFDTGIKPGLMNLAAELLSRTDSFQDTIKIVNDAFDNIANVLDPIIQVLNSVLKPALELLGPVLNVVGGIMRVIAIMLTGLFLAVFEAWNFLVKGINKVLSKFQKAARRNLKIQLMLAGFTAEQAEAAANEAFGQIKLTIDTSGLRESLKNLRGATDDERKIKQKAADEDAEGRMKFRKSRTRETEQTDTLNDNLAEINETMRNVPEGFKVALERFRAIETPAANLSAMGGLSPTTGGNMFQIDQVTVVADDPEQLAEQMQEQSEQESFMNTGSIRPTSRAAATGMVALGGARVGI